MRITVARGVGAFVLILAVLVVPRRVGAAMTAYEPFGYAPAGADLSGQGGPPSFGFSSAWAPGGFNAGISDNYDLATGSLAFGSLLTNGGRTSSLPTTGSRA